MVSLGIKENLTIAHLSLLAGNTLEQRRIGNQGRGKRITTSSGKCKRSQKTSRIPAHIRQNSYTSQTTTSIRSHCEFSGDTLYCQGTVLRLSLNLTPLIYLVNPSPFIPSFCLTCHCEPKAKQSCLYLLVCFVAPLLAMTFTLQGKGEWIYKGGFASL